MERHETAELLDTARRARERTRSQLAALSWFPWLLYGGLSLIGAAVSWRFGGGALGIYWALAAPAGVALTAGYYHRHERRAGLEGRTMPYLLAVGVIVVGSFGSGAIGGAFGIGMLAATGPAFAVAAGMLMFARIERQPALAVAGGALAALAVSLLIAGTAPDPSATILLLASGGLGIVLGAAFWSAARRAT